MPEGEFRLRNYFTWFAFFRSSFASIIVVLSITFIAYSFDLFELREVFTRFWEPDLELIDVVPILLPLGLNIFLDFFSLLQTRFFLFLVNKKTAISNIIIFLFADLAGTYFIFICLSIIPFFLVFIFVTGLVSELDEVSNYIESMISPTSWIKGEDTSFYSVYFYSTFFTSIWIWLFGLSNLLISLFSRFGPVLKVVKYILPVDEKPFRSIGLVAGAIAMLGYWVFAIVVGVPESVLAKVP